MRNVSYNTAIKFCWIEPIAQYSIEHNLYLLNIFLIQMPCNYNHNGGQTQHDTVYSQDNMRVVNLLLKVYKYGWVYQLWWYDP